MRSNQLDDCDRRLLQTAAQRPLIKFRIAYAASAHGERFHSKRVEGLIRRGALFVERGDGGEIIVITRAGRALLDDANATEARIDAAAGITTGAQHAAPF